MAEEAKIVVSIVTDGSKAVKQAKKVGSQISKQTERQANKANNLKFGQKMKQHLDKIKIGVQNIGIGGDKLSKLGELFKGGGWIAVAAGAVTLLAKGAMELWDKMTTSAEEAMLKASKLKQLSQERLKNAFKDSGDASVYFDRLKQLSSVEKLSLNQKVETLALVNQLTKKYGDLGLSISNVTGNVLGLQEAMRKFHKKDMEVKFKESKKAYEEGVKEVNPQVQTTLRDVFGRYSSIFQNGNKGLETLLNTDSDREVYGSTVVERKLSEDEKRKRKLWNSGGLQGKIAFLEEVLDKDVKTEQQIEAVKNLIQKLKELKTMQDQFRAIRNHGNLSDEDYLRNLSLQNKQIETIKKSIREQISEYKKMRKAREEADFESSLKPQSVRIAYNSFRLSENKAEIETLEEEEEKLKLMIFYREQLYEKALKDKEQFDRKRAERKSSGVILSEKDKEKEDHQNRILIQNITSANAELKEENLKLLEIEKKINQKKKQGFSIEEKIARLKKEQAEKDFNALKSDEKKLKILQKKLEIQKKTLQKIEDEHSSASKDKQGLNEDLEKNELKKLELQDERGWMLSQLFKDNKFREAVEIDKKISSLKEELKHAFADKNHEKYGTILDEIKTLQLQKGMLNAELRDKMAKGKPESFTGSKEDWERKLKEVEKIDARIAMIDEQIAYTRQMITETTGEISQKNREMNEANAKILQIEAQILQIKKRSKDFYSQQKQALDEELSIQKLLLQGRFDEAEKLKYINSLKSQGLIQDQKEINLILQKQKALSQVKFNRDLKSQGLDILDQMKPQNRQTELAKRIRKAEEQYGRNLTTGEKDKLKTMVDVEFKLKQMDKLKPDFSELEIKTNELTQRGGGAGYAVAPDVDRVNQQIRDYSSRQLQTLNQIRQILQRGGII